ncbi:hypothetical protein [Geminocystis sp. NIES-3709]|uniref:hypothetical protein n=1 Tax=Geminocystis sp. NIES-3709 TaxID=1617448 RepID=UPI000A9AEA96|nr:hypothetical protein [Geminocystis sp. NIES-3709]
MGGNLWVSALPTSEDIPEEVLATEIIIEAKSPKDNQPLTAAEYTLLKEEIRVSNFPPQIDSELRHKIFLLRILKLLKTFSFQ